VGTVGQYRITCEPCTVRAKLSTSVRKAKRIRGWEGWQIRKHGLYISLLYNVGKLFQKTLLTRVLLEVNERGLLRDEQFEFRPRHSTTLQLARLVERVNRNFDEMRLTGAVFLDVAKAFNTVWVKGLLYKLTVLNFPSYLVKTISSYLDCRTFQTSLQSATSTSRVMRAGVAQGGLVSRTLQPVCKRHTHTNPPRRVSAVRGQYGSHSHVPRPVSSRLLSGGLPR
jgi:hypothetical protein